MAEKAMVVRTPREVAQYGDRDAIEQLGERVRSFLPNGKDMSNADALSLAQLAIAQDLNPFANEIWFVPKVGVVTGIDGYRKMARKQGHYTAQTRPMTPEERKEHNLDPGDIGAVCELFRPDQLLAAVEVNKAAGQVLIPIAPVIGIGIKRPNEPNRFTPTGRSLMWVAKKRAEADALRKAFDFPIGFADNGHALPPEPEVVTLPDWAVEELQDEEPETPEAVLDRNRVLLHGEPEEQDWDAGAFAAGEDATASTRGGEPEPGPEPEGPVTESNGGRPYSAEQVKARLAIFVSDYAHPKQAMLYDPEKARRLAAKLGECFDGMPDKDLKRHSVTQYLFGKTSTKELTEAEAGALWKWLVPADMRNDEAGWLLHPAVPAEAAAVLKAALKDAGQQEMGI